MKKTLLVFLWSLLPLLSLAQEQDEVFTEAVAVPRPILEEAAFGFESTDFQVHYVDSQGLFQDFFTRLMRGGDEADRLRLRLQEMAEAGGGRLLVYSPNPGLAYTVIKSALPDEEDGAFDLTGITIGYAGQKQYGDRLCERICSRQGAFVFIDTQKGMTREPERTEADGAGQ